ncbi:hypothetical protein [Terrabacter sp. MAHUQ-38]|uniref:hypothetical protein n=1 Tax=unclassified Terrabacter TaxID=2630222 RepID=UPI00165D9804|nr:hypothetical protein [Terrabacter sp. MAHUQ-38]MBC9820511.1 hypothetical protein [Terrabacter sp. MAHUQ-38]
MAGLTPYTGLVPSNVNRDAKYRVSAHGEIRLEYFISHSMKELLATADHSDLADMVNAVKMVLNGVPGGPFYINEWGDVLVKGGDGRSCYWAGHYDERLEFKTEDGVVVSPSAPDGLQPGDAWPGPHVGIRYVLEAGAQDVKYERVVSERRVAIVHLSDEVGGPAARETAARISAVKGASGGRFYINEAGEMFGPVSSNDYAHFLYIGHLEASRWFAAPSGYERE